MASDHLRVEGDFFAARSSDARRAVLTREPDGMLRILDADGVEIASAGPGEAEISPRIANIPRRIHFAEAGLFVTPDNDGVDGLDTTRRGRRGALIHRLERFRLHLLALAVFAALCVVGIYRFALPAMVEVAVAVTPPVVPRLISSGAVDSLDRLILSETALEQARRDEITERFQLLAGHSKRGPDGYTLLYRDGGIIGPNAFALPDGKLILTDQLVRLATDDDMILGVLAHEIGHVEHQHSLRQLYRLAGMTAMIMLIAGDVGEAVEEVLVDATALLSLSYSRDHESEADRYSADLMLRAGLDPLSVNRFFEMLMEELDLPDDSGILSTHPATSERIEALEAYVERLRTDPETAR